jgi:hypothetical protein
MDINILFSRLWDEYSQDNPSVKQIHSLFESEGEELVNDHIAFRTLDSETMNIDKLAGPFISNGYIQKGEYYFREKHLYARHYELPADPKAPRVFISQLVLNDCSPFIRDTFHGLMNAMNSRQIESSEMIFKGSVFCPISFETYTKLREESEYAAWFYVFGLRANHFTVSINHLKKFRTIEQVNDLLKSHGFILNSAGGEVKGTQKQLLQQSSTMADIVPVHFREGVYEIPSCYYEFALRFPGEDGKLFSGFIEGSADKIFESTNFYTRK